MKCTKNLVILLATLGLLFVFSSDAAVVESGVESLVAKKAAILLAMHKKAKKALVNAAQDESFQHYFDAEDGAHRSRFKGIIDHISLNVQSHFHVEEMCLISPDGSEISRIVGNKIASDLSNDEASASFFKPGFSQKPRTAYVSPVYLSADANKWVLAYVTPIVVENRVAAILHYEHGLDAYQAALNKGLSNEKTFVVAVNEDGLTVSDSRQAIGTTKQGDNESAEHYFEKFSFNRLNLSEIITAIDGGNLLEGEDGFRYVAAYRNVYHWTLLAIQPVQDRVEP